MEQRIRFLDTPGGRVAYSTVGEGRPIVFPAGWFSNLELDWRNDAMRAFMETLAAERRVVRYDRLGTGLSDRERPPESITLEAELDTLGRLLDEIGAQRATLIGLSFGGALGAAFAATRPERVQRLVAYGSCANGAGVAPAAVRESMPAVVRAHWGLGSRVLAEVFIPDGDPDEMRDWVRAQRESASGEMAATLLELVYRTDVRGLLADVQTPTLVLHRRDDRAIPLAAGRELAALVPGARMVELDGRWHHPWLGDAGSVLRELCDFCGVAPPRPDARDDDEPRPELSARELEVLALVAEGLSDAEVAERLVLSPHTVHRHVANIRTKLGQPSRAAAAALATRLGLI